MAKKKRKRGRPKQTRLTQNKLLAIEYIASGKSLTETANRLGVSRESVSKWKNHDPRFQAALRAACEEYIERTRKGLQRLGPAAVDRLAGDLVDPRNANKTARFIVEMILHRIPSIIERLDLGDDVTEQDRDEAGQIVEKLAKEFESLGRG
jgi:transcriptional regulator with XRE-family HTH domain